MGSGLDQNWEQGGDGMVERREFVQTWEEFPVPSEYGQILGPAIILPQWFALPINTAGVDLLTQKGSISDNVE